MMEIIGVAAVFCLAYWIGNSSGQNTGYHIGWTDKESGNPYKQPK